MILVPFNKNHRSGEFPLISKTKNELLYGHHWLLISNEGAICFLGTPWTPVMFGSKKSPKNVYITSGTNFTIMFQPVGCFFLKISIPWLVVFVGPFFAKSQKLCPEFTGGWAFEARGIWNACLANRQAAGVQRNVPKLQVSTYQWPTTRYDWVDSDLKILKLIVNYDYNQNTSYMSKFLAWAFGSTNPYASNDRVNMWTQT